MRVPDEVSNLWWGTTSRVSSPAKDLGFLAKAQSPPPIIHHVIGKTHGPASCMMELGDIGLGNGENNALIGATQRIPDPHSGKQLK